MLLGTIAGCGGPDPMTKPADDATASIRSPTTTPRPQPREEFVEPGTVPGRTHWVEPGETLSSLARRYYGNENQWRKIYYANSRRLTDPNNLPVGIKLIIP